MPLIENVIGWKCNSKADIALMSDKIKISRSDSIKPRNYAIILVITVGKLGNTSASSQLAVWKLNFGHDYGR